MRRGKRCPINKEFRTYSERTLTPSSLGENPYSPAKWNLNDLGRWGFLFALFFKYIAVEGTTKNEKAREIRLTDEIMEILKIIKSQNSFSTEIDFICVTKTGKVNTATNLEHRMAVIFKNADLKEYTG